MTETLIDTAVVIAVLGLSFEGGEILVRLLLAAIEPTGQQEKTARSSVEAS